MGQALSDPLAQRVAWALIHFLWQGGAIAATLALALRMPGLRSPQRRYAVSVASLVLMALCPLVTLEFRLQPVSIAFNSSPKAELQQSELQQADDEFLPAISPTATAHWQPYVLSAWMIGVLLLACRLLAGYCGTLWMRGGRSPLPTEVMLRLLDPCRRLGVVAVARVYASPRVREAVVVGFWRPIVLVPLAWLAELSPDVLEAVIAHELAHLRRWDRWVVLFQRIVETLLFYHPAVWWVSRRASIERELCCDELAVLATGRRLAYARALETVGRRQLREASLLLATSFQGEPEMNLLNRVRNVLGLATPRESGLGWPAGVLALALTAGMACWSLSAALAAEEEGDKPKVAREGEAPKEGEQEKRKSPEAEAAKRKSAEAEAAKKVSPEELYKRKLEAAKLSETEKEAYYRKLKEAWAKKQDSEEEAYKLKAKSQFSEAESAKRKQIEAEATQRKLEAFGNKGEARPLDGFRPETEREAALYKLIVTLRDEVAQLRQEVNQMRKGGKTIPLDIGPRDGLNDGGAKIKIGPGDGVAPKKPGPKDGEVRKPGPRDGEGEVKKGPRDGDAPEKKGPRDGEKAPR
jgi:beta-lactamase regulating signal transducer with metallopeptidase domain